MYGNVTRRCLKARNIIFYGTFYRALLCNVAVHVERHVLSVICCLVDTRLYGQGDLVFVIDDTGSMMDDIDQVKTQVDKLFDAAFTSNSSSVEDFIIVTFNDPSVKHRTTTKDREVFKKALNEITVDGGGDCPEMAMAGLELALQRSRKDSLVYLFTDADAKDTNKKETVQTMAKEKNNRLMFMLTGTCYGEVDNRTYFDLAEATGGQVFSLFKKEVGQMLEHARETVRGGYFAVVALKTAAAERSFDADTVVSNVRTSNFTIDDATKEVLVSVSAPDPEVILTGPDGTTPTTEDVAKTSGSKVFKIIEAKPGTYTIIVTSEGPSSVVVNKKSLS